VRRSGRCDGIVTDLVANVARVVARRTVDCSVSRVIACVTVSVLLALSPPPALADPAAYEPGADPAVGVNLISWWNFGASGASVWEDAVQRIYDHGLRAVSISPLRFVKPTTGEIRLSDGTTTAPDLAHIEAAVARASALGMSVTVNPFIEPDSFSKWRAELNFTGAAKTEFWNDYQAYMVEVAAMAEAHGAQRMNIGTELNSLVQDAAHNADWAAVIAAVAASFSGQIGYAANWDAYDHPNLTATIWEHPDVDFMGVDTYVPLADDAGAQGIGNPSVALLQTRWLSVLDNPAGGFAHGIVPFAAARKGGAGMPLLITEHGSIPYDKTTVRPYSSNRGAPDPYEQRNDYEALMRALDGRADNAAAAGRLEEVHIWQWSMPGTEGSAFLLDPDGEMLTHGAKAARYLAGFVTGNVPDPGAPLDAGEQVCVNALNKSLAEVVRAQGRDSGLCLRDAARGRLGSLAADDCLTADRRGMVARARQKTDSAAASSCASVTPDFGPTSPAVVNQAAVDGGVALVHDAFGPDLDSTVISQAADRDAARCQQAVALAVSKCLDERTREFGRCKQSLLKIGAGSAADLVPCIGSDPADRIARRCDQPAPNPDGVRREVARRCTAAGVDLSVAFPPCASSDAETVHACLTAAARHRACLIIDGADGLGASCP
jgi:hypothetical protein